MGQFIDQVNKTNQLIMSARQLKEQEKEQKTREKRREQFAKDMAKNALQDLQNTFQDVYKVEGVKAFDLLNKINVRNKIINDIIKEYKKDIKNTVILENIYNTLENNYLKTNKNIYNIYNASEENNDIDYMEIEKSIKKCYKQNGILAYDLLENGKFEILEQITTPKNYLKVANFHDKINKKYYNIYKQEQNAIQKHNNYIKKRNKVIISSIFIGLYSGFKSATKPKRKRF